MKPCADIRALADDIAQRLDLNVTVSGNGNAIGRDIFRTERVAVAQKKGRAAQRDFFERCTIVHMHFHIARGDA